MRGYHGTTKSAADSLLSGNYQLSSKDSNWLGCGLYFFEENIVSAIDWAFEKVRQYAQMGIQDSAAIFAADIDLAACLDLCSSEWDDHLRGLGQALERINQLPRQHGPVFYTARRRRIIIEDLGAPLHTEDEHFADCKVIDALVADLLTADPNSVSSVRASFAVGCQPFTNSHFFDATHIQIAVLRAEILSNVEVIHPIPTRSHAGRIGGNSAPRQP